MASVCVRSNAQKTPAQALARQTTHLGFAGAKPCSRATSVCSTNLKLTTQTCGWACVFSRASTKTPGIFAVPMILTPLLAVSWKCAGRGSRVGDSSGGRCRSRAAKSSALVSDGDDRADSARFCDRVCIWLDYLCGYHRQRCVPFN